MNLNELKQQLCDGAIPPDEREVLDAGSRHNYQCTCLLCLRWWVLLGPDGGEPGQYGNFSREEVLAEANRWGKEADHLT